MEFTLKNIGPISEVNIDINSNLSFIYGKNNIGKSYAITIIYLLLKAYAFESKILFRRSFFYFFDMSFSDSYKQGANAILEQIKKTTKDDIEISEYIKKYAADLISALFLEEFENSLKSSFGDISSLKNKITKKDFEIYIKNDRFILKIFEQDNKLKLEFSDSKKYIFRKINRHFYPRDDGNKVTLYYNYDNQFISDLNSFIIDLYRKNCTEILAQNSSMYFLPASRSGLYRALNAFSQIFAELAKKRTFLEQKIILPSISEQDSDYFSMINSINTKKINTDYNNIAEKIENNLLHGSVKFDQKTKQILFHPNNTDVTMEILGASSMVAEVSPIVLFLRHIISSHDELGRKNHTAKPIIFIEEPEAHLHPEAQVILIECFAELINNGAKLIITSHSNYIFSKLNNLIAEKKVDESDVTGYYFSNTRNGSESKKLNKGNLGLEDINFIDVSEKLYDEKLRIIENME